MTYDKKTTVKLNYSNWFKDVDFEKTTLNMENSVMSTITTQNPMHFDAYFYHDKCSDGLFSMAIAHQFIDTDKHYTIVPCTHGDVWNYDFVKGKRVLFLDFAFKSELMARLADLCEEMVVIDHHVSQHADMVELVEQNPKVSYIYDVNKSGAGLAWEYFYPNEIMPFVITMVQDRDLWTKRFPESEAFALAVRANKLTLTAATLWVKSLASNSINKLKTANAMTADYIQEGEALLKYRQGLVRDIASNAYYSTLDDGTKCLRVCCPPGFISDVGAYLAERKNCPNGVSWMFYEQEHKVINSLRVSAQSSFDASAYAKTKGGGGHTKAAGWTSASQ